jgi:hypothetical protein
MHPDDLIPDKHLVRVINQVMLQDLTSRKLHQNRKARRNAGL